jgi:hypothetical protein
MSGKFRCQVALERQGARPEDAIVNTWYFDSDQTFEEDADDVAGRLVTFYTAIKGFYSDLLTGNGRIKVYDMADPEPRAPGHVRDFALAIAASSPDFPAEVALCLSMEAAQVSGTPQARRRGRVFLGPINNGVIGATTLGDVTVLSSARDAILAAAKTLATGPDLGDGRLSVFSPTTAGAPLGEGPGQYTPQQLDDSFHDVVKLWIDDRLDTQRRRGGAPTARTTVTVP